MTEFRRSCVMLRDAAIAMLDAEPDVSSTRRMATEHLVAKIEEMTTVWDDPQSSDDDRQLASQAVADAHSVWTEHSLG